MLVLGFGSIAAADDRVVKLVYSGTPTILVANFSGSPTSGSVRERNVHGQLDAVAICWYWDFGDGRSHGPQSLAQLHGGRNLRGCRSASNASGQRTLTQNNYISVNATPSVNFAFYKVWGVVERRRRRNSRITSPAIRPPGPGPSATAGRRRRTYRYLHQPARGYVASDGERLGQQHLHEERAGAHSADQGGLQRHQVGPSGAGADDSPPFTDESSGPDPPGPGFGDGGTSTVQNPSHTYTTTGTYSVTLTATQSYVPYGSVTFTMPNYITACNEAIVYPDSYYIHWSASDGWNSTSSPALCLTSRRKTEWGWTSSALPLGARRRAPPTSCTSR